MRPCSTGSPRIANALVFPGGPVIDEGGELQLNCFLEGFPDPQVQWKKNGVVITESSTSITILQGAVAVLRFQSVTMEDNGNYTCAASNAAGYAEFTFVVDRIRLRTVGTYV